MQQTKLDILFELPEFMDLQAQFEKNQGRYGRIQYQNYQGIFT